jgi:peptide/nickel transport system substrate-binding protein
MDPNMNRKDKNLSSPAPARAPKRALHPRASLRALRTHIAIFATAAMVLALAVGLSACGGSSATGAGGGSTDGSSSDVPGATGTAVNVVGTEGATKPTGTPKSGGTINYAHEMETPCLTGGWIQEAYIERQYADNLVSMAKGGKIVPWLATKWTTSKDHLTWTFTLKPGVKFTNGEPLDAKAVVENFYAWLNPETINPTVQTYIGAYFKSAKVINDTTFQVVLSKPYAPLLPVISQGYFGILSPSTYKGGAETICNEPVGSGPFIVDKWTHGQNITFSRNDNYNSAPQNAVHQGPAYAEKLIWSYVNDPTTRYGSLTTGQSNVIYDVPGPDWATAQSEYEVQQYITPGRPDTLDLNTINGPFKDKKVREAFAYGADREAATASAFEGKTPYNGNGALSQTTPNFNSDLEDTWPYNPEKAEQLLDQAGWKENSDGVLEKDGEKLDILLIYGANSIITNEGATVLQDLQAQWKEIGFNVTLKPLAFAELFAAEYTKPTSYDATIGYWTSPTAGVMLITWRPWDGKEPNAYNNPFYNDPHLIDLIEKGNASFTEAEKNKYYGEAQEIVTKREVAVVGVYTQETTLAVEPNLKGVWLEASQGEPVFSDAYFEDQS